MATTAPDDQRPAFTAEQAEERIKELRQVHIEGFLSRREFEAFQARVRARVEPAPQQPAA